MSTIGITTGLKALLAAQLSLQTAGHNIANANVEGYSRQSVLLSTDIPVRYPSVGFIGTGVKADGIVRSTDELLERRIQVQNRGLGRLTKEASILSQVEDYFKEPAEGSLSALFSNFFSALNDMTLDPTDSTLRADVVMAGEILCDGFTTLSRKLTDFEDDLELEISTRLKTVNQLAKEIHEVTDKIAVTVSSKQQANELYDKRNLLLKELNSIVDAEVVEGKNGQISVLVGGRILASHGYSTEIEMDKDDDDNVYLHMKNDSSALEIKDGEIAELMDERMNVIPNLLDKIDTLAGQLIYEFNLIHSTGLPLSGPFAYLQGEYMVKDLNYDGIVGNEILSESGLPFLPKAGSLYFTVTNLQTGELEQTEVQIDPARQSLRGLAQILAQIPHINAYVDSQGKMNINAGSGYAFDFAPRLDPAPDKEGTFGNSGAMIVGSATYPVTLNPGDALQLTVDGVPVPQVNFAGGTYTAQDIVTEINNQTGIELASVVDGRLVIKSTTTGSTSTLQIADAAGTPSSTLGLSTALETGSDLGVTATLDGKYTGDNNTSFRFEPLGDGTIGVTPNLSVAVYNDLGDQIAILNVGEGYSPGDTIEVVDGVKVSFTSGDISATSGDFFNAMMIANSDTSNILAALGLNTFFTGSESGDINVREEIIDSPTLISAAQSDEEGDNLNVLRLADLADTSLEGLNSNSMIDFYSGVIGQLGLKKELADDLLDVQQLMMTNLENQRASVSGVSIDEELLSLDRFQQMLEASTRFLQVTHEVMDTIINI